MARDFPPVAERKKRGAFPSAQLRREATARIETAPGGRIHRAWHVTRQHDPLAASLESISGTGTAEISACVYGCAGAP